MLIVTIVPNLNGFVGKENGNNKIDVLGVFKVVHINIFYSADSISPTIFWE